MRYELAWSAAAAGVAALVLLAGLPISNLGGGETQIQRRIERLYALDDPRPTSERAAEWLASLIDTQLCACAQPHRRRRAPPQTWTSDPAFVVYHAPVLRSDPDLRRVRRCAVPERLRQEATLTPGTLGQRGLRATIHPTPRQQPRCP